VFLQTLRSRATDYDTPMSLIACDANERHFRSEAFDLVVGKSILHHLLDYDVTLRTCHDVLRPGGAAVFFEPVLEGKAVVTLLMALLLRCDEVTNGGVFSPDDRRRLRLQVRHQLKSVLNPQSRESLAQVEDKYIFEIDQLAEVGKRAGFTEMECHNFEEVQPTYWPYLAMTCQQIGIPAEKIEHYRWIGEEFANTYGLLFPEKLLTPSVFFVFRK